MAFCIQKNTLLHYQILVDGHMAKLTSQVILFLQGNLNIQDHHLQLILKLAKQIKNIPWTTK